MSKQSLVQLFTKQFRDEFSENIYQVISDYFGTFTQMKWSNEKKPPEYSLSKNDRKAYLKRLILIQLILDNIRKIWVVYFFVV